MVKFASSQQSILAGLKSQPQINFTANVRQFEKPVAVRPTLTVLKIVPANGLPKGADFSIRCPGARFKPRTIELEGGILTTCGDKLAYHRRAFGKEISFFSYGNAVARDARWIAGLLHRAGVQQASVVGRLAGSSNMQLQFERQLKALDIRVMAAIATTDPNRQSIWQHQPKSDKWLSHIDSSNSLPPLPVAAASCL